MAGVFLVTICLTMLCAVLYAEQRICDIVKLSQKENMSAKSIPVNIPMNDKRTLRYFKGRLCCWPGSVQRWIAEDHNGELVVNGVPGLGHVCPTRLEYGTAKHVLAELPERVRALLAAEFPVVVNVRELPDFARALV